MVRKMVSAKFSLNGKCTHPLSDRYCTRLKNVYVASPMLTCMPVIVVEMD